MKVLLLICAGLLLLAIADLPIGYYTFLRIAVTIGSMAIIIVEIKNGLNYWIIIFGLIVLIFNPVIPIYLHDKGSWIPIDLLGAILFIIKAFLIKTTNKQ
jgi:hypothetical protein